ncbi:MAG: ArnT family glycosyltransferase [Thermoanaerobaculia bacterium]
MTPLQKRILVLLSIIVGLTRFLALARSLNDWDEALFSLGVAEYDVNLHHPHPPGYPLFILAAKAVHFLGVDEFRSLQVVVLLGGLLLFPALVLFARECGFAFATSVCGALIFVFLPNVWIYGGTGFSDVPATAIALIACWLLLRGRRDGRAYLLGAIALGVAGGIRIPGLLIGAAPAILATIHRLRARDYRKVVLAIVLGGAIAGGSYLGAALASGTIEQYRFMLRAQSEYVSAVDSWRNPHREPLGEVAKIFFIWPVDQQEGRGWLTAIAVVGIVATIVRRRWTLLLPLSVFLPYMLVAWLNLDVQTANRYAIAYVALHALYVSHALGVMARRPAIQGALATVIVVAFAVWTWPALRLQRSSDAPGAGALNWIVRNVPVSNVVYVHGAFRPQGDYYLRDHDKRIYEDVREIADVTPASWVVEPRIIQGGHNFVWPHNSLWKIIRRRNFEASVLRLASLIVFREGFYQEEGTGTETFRWTAKEAHATLPPMPKSGRLRMRIYVPIDAIQPPPTIEVRVNGELVERFIGAEAIVEKSWTVASRNDAPNELVIATSDVVVPGNGDSRPLGLRIDAISWAPF